MTNNKENQKSSESNFKVEESVKDRKVNLKGLVLCKFDEVKGFIPVNKYPGRLFARKPEILEKIAKNAIGMGEELEYTLFSISGTKCLAKRFYIESEEARGGKEIYALAIIADEIEDSEDVKEKLSNVISKMQENWSNYQKILKSFYKQLKSLKKPLSPKVEDKKHVKLFQPLKRPALVEKVDRKISEISESPLPIRGLIFILGMVLLTFSFAMYEITTIIFYATWGALLFNLYARKDWPLYLVYVLVIVELALTSSQAIATKLFNLTVIKGLQPFPATITSSFYIYIFLALLSGFLISMGTLGSRKAKRITQRISFPYRDLIIIISLCIITYLIYVGYNLFTLTLMLISSLLICSLITVREKLSKTCLILIFIELLLLLLKVVNLPTLLIPELFYPKFPDPSEIHYATLSFISGILIYLGSSKGKLVNKRGIIILLLYILINFCLISITYVIAS